MKQHITVEQLKQLSESELEQYMQVIGYDVPQVGVTFRDIEMLPLASIGQMIEFLMENNELEDGYDVICKSWGKLSLGYFTGEYCDFLWEAVKEVLKSKDTSK